MVRLIAMMNGYPQQGGGYDPPYAGGFWPGPYDIPAPPTPQQQEKKKIRRCGNFLGLALVLYTVIGLLTSFALYFVAWAVAGSNLLGQLETQAATTITYVASFVIPFVIYMALERMPLRAALPLRKFNGRITLMAIPVFLGVSMAANWLVSLLGALFSATGVEATAPDFALPNQTAALALYIINMTVLPAFLEEFVFRGVILQSLRRFGDAFAVGISAVIFGLMHMNLIQAPYAVIMGLLFGYLAVRTGSLWTGILLHFMNNTISVLFQLLQREASFSEQVAINAAYMVLCLLLGALGLLIYILKAKKLWFFHPAGTLCSGGAKTLYLFTSVGMVIALLHILLVMVTTLRWVG